MSEASSTQVPFLTAENSLNCVSTAIVNGLLLINGGQTSPPFGGFIKLLDPDDVFMAKASEALHDYVSRLMASGSLDRLWQRRQFLRFSQFLELVDEHDGPVLVDIPWKVYVPFGEVVSTSHTILVYGSARLAGDMRTAEGCIRSETEFDDYRSKNFQIFPFQFPLEVYFLPIRLLKNELDRYPCEYSRQIKRENFLSGLAAWGVAFPLGRGCNDTQEDAIRAPVLEFLWLDAVRRLTMLSLTDRDFWSVETLGELERIAETLRLDASRVTSAKMRALLAMRQGRHDPASDSTVSDCTKRMRASLAGLTQKMADEALQW